MGHPAKLHLWNFTGDRSVPIGPAPLPDVLGGTGGYFVRLDYARFTRCVKYFTLVRRSTPQSWVSPLLPSKWSEPPPVAFPAR